MCLHLCVSLLKNFFFFCYRKKKWFISFDIVDFVWLKDIKKRDVLVDIIVLPMIRPGRMSSEVDITLSCPGSGRWFESDRRRSNKPVSGCVQSWGISVSQVWLHDSPEYWQVKGKMGTDSRSSVLWHDRATLASQVQFWYRICLLYVCCMSVVC